MHLSPLRHALAPTLLLLLAACDGGKDEPGDTDTDSGGGETAETDETDTGEAPADEDRDGYTSDVDCDDNDYRVNPGAVEVCDGLDNDCEGGVDEDFDGDGDGHLDEAACKGGDDCDDHASSVYTGAPENPYDGVDQDCDGADLTDVDGDGFDALAVGGDDCDDEDGDVNPAATDTPFDGVDQDCSGTDNHDADGDGHDAAGEGGDDCDDADPAVHPGARDWLNDGVDADCDDEDGAIGALEDEVVIDGESGQGDLAGYSVATCDLDEDGFDDLVVSAPFGDGYLGQIGVWYGGDVAFWGAGLAVAEADTLITSSSKFLGFGLVCTDVDGDGHADLVAGRGEIHYGSTYDTDWGVVFFYGDGGRWGATLDESDAAAELSFVLGVTPDVPTVYSPSFWAFDLDGDAASEVILYPTEDTGYTNGDGLLYVLPGGRHAASGDFASQGGVWTAETTSASSLRSLRPGGDPDGDGTAAVLAGEPWAVLDTADTGDPGLLSGGDPEGSGLAGLGGLRVEGLYNLLFGWDMARLDLDGDGAEDLVVSGVGGEVGGEWPGYVYAWSGYGELWGMEGLVVETQDWEATGTGPSGYLGWALAPGGDLDADGGQDLWVSEPAGGDDGKGRVYLLSGARLVDAGDALSGALLAFDGQDPYGSTGIALATGDFDGDGAADLVVPSYTYTTLNSSRQEVYTGRAYVVFGSGS